VNLRFPPYLALLLAALLSACGGDGKPAPGVLAAPPVFEQPGDPVFPPDPPETVPTDPHPAYLDLHGICAQPRTGADRNGVPFTDQQGSVAHERWFLKSWLEDTYLWYRELPSLDPALYPTAVDYFDAMKTPLLTEAGKPKDRFHFTYPTDQWLAMQQAGVSLGYGLTWSRNSPSAPRYWFVSMVDQDSPAAAAKLARGAQLLTIDGVDFVNARDKASVALFNAALGPSTAGEKHRFGFLYGGLKFEVELAAREVFADPVQNVAVYDTPAGKVGYLTFNSFNAVSESELFDAFTGFRQAGVTDLVLDMRYNGGGLVYLAAELAYMIAGPQQTKGKPFEIFMQNDKQRSVLLVPFVDIALGFSAQGTLRPGTALPTLGLKRVTVITTIGTCSASEAVINALRGVDVQVDIVGNTTCGKPYAFTPMGNCGTTYFAVQIQGVNAKLFGDFADGFAPTCNVNDDLARALGDRNEVMLSTALSHLAGGPCPVVRARQVALQPVHHPAQEVAVFDPAMPPRGR